MNLFEVPVEGSGVRFGTTTLQAALGQHAPAGGRVTLGVRPEDLDIADQGLPMTVEVVEELGADAYVYGSMDGAEATDKPIVVRVDGRIPPEKGARIHLAPKASHVHYFDSATGGRLGG